MNISNIVSLRLTNQHLSPPNFTTPSEVVKHLSAVQAQDFPAGNHLQAVLSQNNVEYVLHM